MTKYQCETCGDVFDEIEEFKKWEDLEDDWSCKTCGALKLESDNWKNMDLEEDFFGNADDDEFYDGDDEDE